MDSSLVQLAERQHSSFIIRQTKNQLPKKQPTAHYQQTK